jgi:UDP-N-acetylmuramate-alanine ligase
LFPSSSLGTHLPEAPLQSTANEAGASRKCVPKLELRNEIFAIHHRGRRLLDVQLQVPGRHNVLNALAAAALAWESGVAPEEIARGLASFRGLHRRLERLGTRRGVTLIDDYAHHPTEVAVSLETVRQMCPGRRIFCVFQPHQASRTARLLDELAASLHNADWVAVADIFRTREAPFRSGEVTAADLARRMRELASTPVEVAAVHRLDEIARLLENRLTPGDVLVTLGAGDIARIYSDLLDHSPFNPGTCAGRGDTSPFNPGTCAGRGDIARIHDDFLDGFRQDRAAG